MRVWLKEWRTLNDFTQRQAADQLDIPETTLASYEQGYRTPSVNRAKEISKKMNAVTGKEHVEWTYFFDSGVHITSISKEVI